MRDDGQGGDVKANDGTYSGDAGRQLAEAPAAYALSHHATDGQAQSLRVPYADDPQPNFAYFVYDGVPAWRGASQPRTTPVQDFGADVFKPPADSSPDCAEIDVTNSQYVGTCESAHFYGTLVEGGRVYDHIEFENRGEFSTYQSGKNKWRFHFQRGHEFVGRDDLGRAARRAAHHEPVGLRDAWVPTNRSAACLDESVAFRLYELAGVPRRHMNYLHSRHR